MRLSGATQYVNLLEGAVRALGLDPQRLVLAFETSDRESCQARDLALMGVEVRFNQRVARDLSPHALPSDLVRADAWFRDVRLGDLRLAQCDIEIPIPFSPAQLRSAP